MQPPQFSSILCFIFQTETAPEKGETPVDKKSGELQEEQSKSESLLEPRKSSHLPVSCRAVASLHFP